ncbi:acyltransferase family protein [Pseudobutyrivibrio xylanivorans]|uniref:Peptidoglycan/LPS O-acetylase OafA/YrhL, contains acyltransferase and SGNH-hydrolase domains n=1 Tax=Pseudobutyrivibrio xylanivorans TaxID=185007 RepID=A0A1G5S6R1_PSEXY|nr:acyltransferase [Pseudobutyrivibrio xylanivorans]SCZ81249.1 Peptidoglycan/LPS O-acetylase OafA/YrhL, contains acyltransferase and SGNH-hydrolase domains [Pseudobutyrivibrio xylanivorans]
MKKGDNSLQLLNKYRAEIMGIFALWIFIFHIWLPDWNLPMLLVLIKTMGYSGVDVFFLISGIGMTYAIKKQSIPVFYARRMKRLLPAYLIVGIIHAVKSPWSLMGFLANMSGYKFFTENIYSILWFVPAMGTFYFFFPWVYKLAEKTGATINFFADIIVVWAIASPLLIGTLREDLFIFTNRIPIFTVGVIFGLLIQNKDIFISRAGWITLILINILSVYLAYLTIYTDYFLFVPFSRYCIPTFFTAISFALLFAKMCDLLSNYGDSKFVIISKKILLFYGAMSLEFYCFQELYINAIFNYREGEFWVTKFISVLILDTVTAFVVSKVVVGFFAIVDKGMGKIKEK